MRAAIGKLELATTNPTNREMTRRFRVVVADASLDFMAVVLCLLEFHDAIDLIGRASHFEDVVQLVVSQGPDLVLLDLDMPLASLAIPAMILAARSPMRIIGMRSGETAPLTPIESLTTMDALVHKEHLRDEFLAVLQSVSAAPGSALRFHHPQSKHLISGGPPYPAKSCTDYFYRRRNENKTLTSPCSGHCDYDSRLGPDTTETPERR